jgi:hypothetical protein
MHVRSRWGSRKWSSASAAARRRAAVSQAAMCECFRALAVRRQAPQRQLSVS